MDGQNFQNGQDNQNTQYGSYNSYAQPTGGQTVDTSSQQSSSQNVYMGNYQDNTQQYTQSSSVYSVPAPEEPAGTPGLAVASLVMGILSITLGCCCGVGFIFAIAGLIMAIVANKDRKTGVGTAGLVCSIIGIVFSLMGVALIFAGSMSQSLWICFD